MSSRFFRASFLLLFSACATQGPAKVKTTPTLLAAEAAQHTAKPPLAVYAPSAIKALVGLLPGMPEPVTSFGAASDGRHLYTLGGYSGEPHVYSREGQSKWLSRVALDGSGDWEHVSALSRGLQGLALVVQAGKLCRVGGTEARNAAGAAADLHSIAEVACYDPSTNSWTDLPALPIARSSHEVAVIGSVLYVAGGWTLNGSASSGSWQEDVLSLDLSAPAKGWSSVKAPFKRRALGVANIADKLVIVGGLTPEAEPSKRVDVFDPKTQAWSQGPDFPDNAFGVAVESAGDAVYASARSGAIYRWRLGDSAWQRVTRLAFGRFFHQLVSVSPNELIAVGGISGMHNEGRTRHVERVMLNASGPRIVAWSMAYPGRAKNRQGSFVHDDYVYLFGGNNSLEQHDFAAENFVDETWRLHLPSLSLAALEPFPAKRQTMQTLSREEQGFALGGFGHNGEKAISFADGYSFDFEIEHWTPSTRLPESRTQFGLTEHGAERWVFGGLNYDPGRQGDEAFQHVTHVLHARPEKDAVFADANVALPGERRAFAGAVMGDSYFMIGGMRGGFDLVEDCLRFDFAAKTFSPLACPGQARLSGALIPIKGQLYLLGGSVRGEGGLVSSRDMVALDPAVGTFRSVLAELPFETRHMHAIAWQERILLISTHNADGRIDVAVIDPAPSSVSAE